MGPDRYLVATRPTGDTKLPASSKLEIVRSGPQTLQLRGELCLASLTLISEALAQVEGPVTLELSELTFMDSTGLRVILTRLRESPVELVNVLPQVARLLDLSGLEACEDLLIRHAAA